MNIFYTLSKFRSCSKFFVLCRSQLAGQQKFIDKIVWLIKTVHKDNSNRKRKIDKLQAMLSHTDSSSDNFKSFDALPLPLDPEVRVRFASV